VRIPRFPSRAENFGVGGDNHLQDSLASLLSVQVTPPRPAPRPSGHDGRYRAYATPIRGVDRDAWRDGRAPAAKPPPLPQQEARLPPPPPPLPPPRPPPATRPQVNKVRVEEFTEEKKKEIEHLGDLAKLEIDMAGIEMRFAAEERFSKAEAEMASQWDEAEEIIRQLKGR